MLGCLDSLWGREGGEAGPCSTVSGVSHKTWRNGQLFDYTVNETVVMRIQEMGDFISLAEGEVYP